MLMLIDIAFPQVKLVLLSIICKVLTLESAETLCSVEVDRVYHCFLMKIGCTVNLPAVKLQTICNVVDNYR